MSGRELVVLGTASQAPTRERNHNGYLLRWDGQAVLFDPGEGTQRQLLLAGESVSQITHICLTHVHGDHTLGLPGVLERMALDRIAHTVDLWFPASAADVVEHLRGAASGRGAVPLRLHPTGEGPLCEAGAFHLRARALDHSIDTLGYRVEEPDGRSMLPAALEAAGIRGPDVGRLQEQGWLRVGERVVRLEDCSVPRPGQRVAFVMDTRPCDAAVELAEGADLLVCEATFLEHHANLADRYGHLTAAQAALIARDAGARLLVLTHFSQRYADLEAHQREAEGVFDTVVVARDLQRIPVPRHT